jgi:dipeptidyl aminopeptidase/acylaminoacyl peptidase
MTPRSALLAALLLFPLVAPAQTAAPASANAGGAAYNLGDFIRDDRFVDVKISPKGTYVAATVPLSDGDKTVMVILKPGQKEPYGHVTLKEYNTHVADFWWVSDERVLFTIGERAGGLEQPVSYGEIWGTNADGSKQGVIAGARASGSETRASGRARAESASLQMVDTLIDSDDDVLVSVAPFAAGEIPFTTLERMNVFTGTRKPVARAPVRGASFVTDLSGQARFASGLNRDFKEVLYYRKDDKSEWKVINDESVTGKKMSAVGFSADNATAYLQAEEDKGPDSVRAFDVATETMKQVARDEIVEPAALVRAVGKRYPIGVAFWGGRRPRFEYFDANSADAKLHQALQAKFDGDVALPISSTLDGRHVLLEVTSDRNPGELYMFDTQAKKIEPFMNRADWLDRSRLGKAQPAYFKSRDGVDIDVLLTTPAGSDGKNMPLIVHPHGGPFGVQDVWGYDRDVQMMAAHGYAVLQVNFRGSGGYGKAFLELGHKQWGLTMQDDLTDATLWAIREGIADKNRICIYGASYGGYASLMGVAKEPDLYKCAVGYVGVYDLNMLWGRGDISQSSYGRDFLDEALGKDQLDSSSPNKLASRIKVPVFLAAGGADVRAPQSHSEAMARSLKAAGKSVETMYYSTEGHGFVKEENQIAYYSKLFDFFHRYIGGRAPVAPPSKKK